MDGTVYKIAPLTFADLGGKRCPVFSMADDYVRNYERIARDHLAVFAQKGINPFMEEEFWVECESATAELVRGVTPAGAKVLDVGCGMGRLLGKLPEYERYGMDISGDYLAHAAKQPIDLCVSKVEDMPYLDELFDTVVCTDVLEHVIDLNAAVAQLFRVVKRAGHLVIRVPYRENLEPYLHPEYPYTIAHLRNFDEFSLRLLFEKIFGGAVVRDVRGPYLVNTTYLKLRILRRPVGLVIRTSLRVVGIISKAAKRRLAPFFYHPVEINLAIRKA